VTISATLGLGSVSNGHPERHQDHKLAERLSAAKERVKISFDMVSKRSDESGKANGKIVSVSSERSGVRSDQRKCPLREWPSLQQHANTNKNGIPRKHSTPSTFQITRLDPVDVDQRQA
jgi:hypothetical protein